MAQVDIRMELSTILYMEPNKPPAHRSFSQLGTYRKCQHMYYLTKIVGITEDPAVWLASGSAIHELIEKVNHELYAQQSSD